MTTRSFAYVPTLLRKMRVRILSRLLLKSVMVVAFTAMSAVAQSVKCPLSGAYRIDVESSDKLYSVVKGATSHVPFGEQQRFFMDLSTRLTPPDMIAVECRGQRVSIGSTRASKVSFTADGKTHREPRPGGNFVNSRVELKGDSLVFTSNGKAEDNVSVAFQALDGGQRMRVVRKIMSQQLDEPIVIRTVYDRVAASVNWDNFGNAQLAKQEPESRPVPDTRGSIDPADVLRTALDDWISATNRRDIETQMAYYMPRLRAYYLSRDTPREAVRDEKRRVFETARSIDINAEDPEIIFQDGGNTAVMRFHKRYKVADLKRTRSGEVIQELRWQNTNAGWRIFSERDIRVIR